jgi:hypothetical protein
MQNLHEQPVYEAIIERIKNLTSTQKALWGKMNVSQMLAHCCVAFSVPLAEEAMPRPLIGRLIGWMFKSKLYDNVPYKKGLPTSPAFIIKDEKNFEVEQNKLINLTTEFFTKGRKNTGKFPHPMFGTFTPDQWGISMYKHLDHHLRQFGA